MDNVDPQDQLGIMADFAPCIFLSNSHRLKKKNIGFGILFCLILSYPENPHYSFQHTYTNSRYPFGDLDIRGFLCDTFPF